ncbi:MAG: flagellar hook-basal body protein [Oscillospiraceae bacterium]|nr:flagellar hook-basal body protein [Oscillospiraceae bacterium]
MVRGLYISASGMMLQRRHMDVITNNIANAETTGFRRQQLVSHSFDDVLTRRINDPAIVASRRFGNISAVGPMTLGTQVDELVTNFDEGRLNATEFSTDLAIVGDAFFVIQTLDGERYTRSGAFHLDSLGHIVDFEGNFLLSENGPIRTGTLNFTVDHEGTVRIGGEIIDVIRRVSFADNNVLRQQGHNLFFALQPPLDVPNQNQIAQGFLESSNVEIGREMVDMLSVFRVYETNQRMLTMIDETVGLAVNEIGRLR